MGEGEQFGLDLYHKGDQISEFAKLLLAYLLFVALTNLFANLIDCLSLKGLPQADCLLDYATERPDARFVAEDARFQISGLTKLSQAVGKGIHVQVCYPLKLKNFAGLPGNRSTLMSRFCWSAGSQVHCWPAPPSPTLAPLGRELQSVRSTMVQLRSQSASPRMRLTYAATTTGTR